MAFTAVVIALVAAFASASNAQKASFVLGGATSIEKLAGALVVRCRTGPYPAVGSGQGISNFLNGQYVVGCSDQPMSQTEQNLAGSIAKKYGACTIPVVLSLFGFYVRGSDTAMDGSVQLDAAQTLRMFSNRLTSWAGIAGSSGATGDITPVARSDSSGTTFTVKLFWSVSGAIAQVGVSIALDSAPLQGSWLRTAQGSDGVCGLTANITGAITYAQSGICNTGAFAKLVEVGLKNKAGNYVTSANVNPSQTLPTQFPKNCGVSWSAFGQSLLFRDGLATPPMTSFAYAFIRQKKLSAAGPKGPLGKAALSCWLNTVNSQGFASTLSALKFYNVPATYLTKAKAALASVKI